MKQWHYSLPLLALLSLSSDLGAWGKPRYAPEPPANQPPQTKEFSIPQDQGWYVKESLLIWHPYEDDIDYGARYEQGSDQSFKLSTLAPDFKWGTGVRLAVGRYLPNHQLWDISLTTTYFYGSADKSSNANPTGSSYIISNWSPTQLGEAISKSSANWHLNYFTWDLGFGRSFFMTPTIIVHPHLDLRAALFYIDYENKNTNNGIATKYRSSNDMWAIGPRFGTDFSYNFQTQWSFLGNFSASVLYAGYSMDTHIDGMYFSSPTSVKASKSYNMVAPNLEASIGLGWEEWVRQNTVKIAASFLFEGVQWFNVNRLFQMAARPTLFGADTFVPFTAPNHNAGDLRFFGFSLNLQVDF